MHSARRIGITGAPGSGKSSLITELARRRLARADRLGVLAIDPSSPGHGGAILGDRIRMDAGVQDARLYIRSLASRSAHDGLTDNVGELLEVMDRHVFDEVILETVGIGQTDYTVRCFVDTLVLVLMPESGDTMQAIKSGLMEMPNLYVINKVDLPGAHKAVAETRAIISARRRQSDDWVPEVIETSLREPAGFDALDQAICRHQAWLGERSGRENDLRKMRARYRLLQLSSRRIAELSESLMTVNKGLREQYRRLLAQLMAEL